MQTYRGFARTVRPDYQALLDNLRRKGTPRRVHHMELFHDGEIATALVERCGLNRGLDQNDPWYPQRREIALRRFLGFDYVSCNLVGCDFTFKSTRAEDTAELKRAAGRNYMEEHSGPITTWAEFEKYPWPDATKPEATAALDWYQKNLPEDMCLASHTGHFCELLCWLMGYEGLCIALYEQRDLVQAIADKALAHHRAEVRRFLEFDRVRMLWGSDDMGFRSGLLFSPADMRHFVLSGHKALARLAHDAGRLYLLHSCGNLADIIDDLADDVQLDGKHSFEDTIEDCRAAKQTWGRKMAMIGGIDVDFLCRSDEQSIRDRVRDTLTKCMPGGGYCLGTGNTVANYMPLENYLAMVDEGRLYG